MKEVEAKKGLQSKRKGRGGSCHRGEDLEKCEDLGGNILPTCGKREKKGGGGGEEKEVVMSVVVFCGKRKEDTFVPRRQERKGGGEGEGKLFVSTLSVSTGGGGKKGEREKNGGRGECYFTPRSSDTKKEMRHI